MLDPTLLQAGLLLAAFVSAAEVASRLIRLTRSWLIEVASAKPEWRSSHKTPTPQGGGLGLVAACLVVTAAGLVIWRAPILPLLPLAAAILGLTALGFRDDRTPMPWRVKLAIQFACAALALLALPPVPEAWRFAGLAHAIIVLSLVGFLNLVNFVDGIDEITAAHAVPALIALALAGLLGWLTPASGVLAAATAGATAGFWWWNRHPARIFLGDSGSLPLGLVLGWLAWSLALSGAPAAALLMLGYPLADGGLTLLRRFVAGARLTQPHRDHAYQRAVDTGLPTRRVSAAVALTSFALAVLALTTLLAPHPIIAWGALFVGATWLLVLLTGWLRRP